MKKNYALLYLLALLIIESNICAEYRITFFVRSLPEMSQELNVQDVVNKAYAQTKTAIKQVFSTKLPSRPVDSLFATYAGYVAASSLMDGQIEFPRKQQKESFLFVVTPNIEPVLMLGKTVHHFELLPDLPAAVYKIERIQDEDTGLYYWESTQEKVPANRIIPLNSIVIFARPEDIYIPEGITVTNSNPQLVLPDIYVRSSFDMITNAFNALKIKHFFEQIAAKYKKGTDRSWIKQIVE